MSRLDPYSTVTPTLLTPTLHYSTGLVAVLHLRRWDIEKCFDTWKNDFASGKAWSKSLAGITQ